MEVLYNLHLFKSEITNVKLDVENILLSKGFKEKDSFYVFDGLKAKIFIGQLDKDKFLFQIRICGEDGNSIDLVDKSFTELINYYKIKISP